MKDIFINSLQIHDWRIGSSPNFGVTDFTGLGYPDVRLTSYPKPGEYGTVVPNVLYGGRTLTIKGQIVANNAIDYYTNRRLFEGALALKKDSNSNVIPLTITFTTLDGLQLYVQASVNSLDFPIQWNAGGLYSLVLYAADYALYSTSLQSQYFQTPTQGGAVMPFVMPIVLSPSSGGIGGVVNNGNVETYPVITLTGPLTNPIINNQTVGRYMQLNMTLIAGDMVVIDMKNKTIILNNAQSVIQNLAAGSNFFWLTQGNNILSFQSSSGSDTGNLLVQYRDAYLGI